MSNRFITGGTLAVAMVVLMGGAGWAAERGSAEDQLACTPDVYRLCGSYVPDEDAIVACLNRNMTKLSPACKQVMSRPADPTHGDQDDD